MYPIKWAEKWAQKWAGGAKKSANGRSGVPAPAIFTTDGKTYCAISSIKLIILVGSLFVRGRKIENSNRLYALRKNRKESGVLFPVKGITRRGRAGFPIGSRPSQQPFPTRKLKNGILSRNIGKE